MEIGDITINQDIVQRALDIIRKSHAVFLKMDEANCLARGKEQTEYSSITRDLSQVMEDLEKDFQKAILKNDEIDPKSHE